MFADTSTSNWPQVIYNPITAMGFSALFTFQLLIILKGRLGDQKWTLVHLVVEYSLNIIIFVYRTKYFFEYSLNFFLQDSKKMLISWIGFLPVSNLEF